MAEDPENWTELKAELADWANRTDLTSQIPSFVASAERRFNRMLRTPEMEDVVAASTSAATITMPANFLAVRALHIDADPKVVLEPMTPGELRNRYAAAATGRPQNYALQSGNELLFGPAPDADYAIVLNYWEKIPALGAAQATNWLLDAHPDLYRAASLVELHLFLKDERAVAIWEERTRMLIEELNGLGRRKAAGGAPIRIRPPQVV